MPASSKNTTSFEAILTTVSILLQYFQARGKDLYSPGNHVFCLLLKILTLKLIHFSSQCLCHLFLSYYPMVTEDFGSWPIAHHFHLRAHHDFQPLQYLYCQPIGYNIVRVCRIKSILTLEIREKFQ